jgi:hypothetical protein
MAVNKKIHKYVASSRLSKKGNFKVYTTKDILNITFLQLHINNRIKNKYPKETDTYN